MQPFECGLDDEFLWFFVFLLRMASLGINRSFSGLLLMLTWRESTIRATSEKARPETTYFSSPVSHGGTELRNCVVM